MVASRATRRSAHGRCAASISSTVAEGAIGLAVVVETGTGWLEKVSAVTGAGVDATTAEGVAGAAWKKTRTCCFTPLSKTAISSCLRSVTGLPCLS